MKGESVARACPGDPNGHHWQLHSEEPWLTVDPRPSANRTNIAWSIVGLLVPIMGWTCVAMYWLDRPIRRLGVERRWFCQLCRRAEVTYHKD